MMNTTNGTKLLPARKVRPNRRSVTGIYITRTGEVLEYESQLERDAYLILDFEPSVKRMYTQPLLLLNWYPDCLVRTAKQDILVEVKYESELVARWPELSAKYLMLSQQCPKGLEFRIITDSQVYYPETDRVSLLKKIQFLGRTSDKSHLGALKEQIDEEIGSSGSTTLRSLAKRINSRLDPVSVIKATCSLLATGVDYAVETPTASLLDCVISFSNNHESDLSSSRLLSFESLEKRILTHPCSRLDGGVRIVS